MADEIYSQARYRKGGCISWRYPISEMTRRSLTRWLTYSDLCHAPEQTWLYPAAKGTTNLPLYDWSRPVGDKAIRKLLADCCTYAGITGHVSCHSFRKTFAARVRQASGNDVLVVQQALGHKQLQSTLHYLDQREGELAGMLRNLF